MSTYNTDLDNINNICSLVKEIVELVNESPVSEVPNSIIDNLDLIRSKALTIRRKAQAMENRLKEYKTAIEGLGFKRERKRRWALKEN